MSLTAVRRRGVLALAADNLSASAISSVRTWRSLARPEQLPPEGEWDLAYLRGGRNSGKTWTGARWFAELLVEEDSAGAEWAIVAPTFAAARTTCVEGPSGLLAALLTTKQQVKQGLSRYVESYNLSTGEIRLRTGGVVYLAGASDGAPQLQGKNLRGTWADEIGLWTRWLEAWDDGVNRATRTGRARVIATGTPKRYMPSRALIRRLIKGDERNPAADVQRRLRTQDNITNLPPSYVRRAIEPILGTAEGAQELEGDLLEEGGAVFDTSRVTIVDEWPKAAALCRFWDLAGTEPTGKGDPDWTVGALVALHDGAWWIVDVVRMRGNPGDVEAVVKRTRDADLSRHGKIAVRIEQEGGSSGKTVIDHYRKQVFVGWNFDGEPARSSKLQRATPVATAMSAKNVNLVRAVWNQPLIDEWELFPDDKHDDQVDAVSGAFAYLSSRDHGPAKLGFRTGVLAGAR